MRDSYLVGLNGVGFLIVGVVEGCRKGSRHASQGGEDAECCELHTDEKVLRRCWDARVDEDSNPDRLSFYTIIDSETLVDLENQKFSRSLEERNSRAHL